MLGSVVRVVRSVLPPLRSDRTFGSTGSELPGQGSGPSLCPGPMPQGVPYVQVSRLVEYIRNIMPIRASPGLSRVQSKPLPGRARTPHPPARPDLFSPNDVEEEFCALRPYGILRSSSIQHSRQSYPHATLLSLRSVLHPQLSLDLRSSRR